MPPGGLWCCKFNTFFLLFRIFLWRHTGFLIFFVDRQPARGVTASICRRIGTLKNGPISSPKNKGTSPEIIRNYFRRSALLFKIIRNYFRGQHRGSVDSLFRGRKEASPPFSRLSGERRRRICIEFCPLRGAGAAARGLFLGGCGGGLNVEGRVGGLGVGHD